MPQQIEEGCVAMSYSITPSLREKVRNLAHERRTSASALVREAIALLVEKYEPRTTRERRA